MTRTQQLIFRYLEKARAACEASDAGAFAVQCRILADCAADFVAEEAGRALSSEPVKE